MKKRPYRVVNLRAIDIKELARKVEGREVVVGIDVAKVDMVAAVTLEEQQAIATIKWQHPRQSEDLLGLMSALKDVCSTLIVGMEPTGTYGDALRAVMLKRGFDVRRVSPVRVKHSAEVFDGVPSTHDGKTSAIIAKLVKDGASQPWPLPSAKQREFKACAKAYSLFHRQYLSNLNRLEAELARYWPEIDGVVDLDRVSLWRLLIDVGGPLEIASARSKAAKVLRKAGRSLLSEDRIEAILDASKDSCGVPMTPGELEWLQELVRDIERAYRASLTQSKKLEKASESSDTVAAMAPVIGKTSAAVVYAEVGDPRDYASAAAYEKAIGLNLRECSSGKHKGQLHITKRGSGVARQRLFLAAIRLKKDNAYVKAWVELGSAQGSGGKLKRLIGIMRKLSRALWHVAKGDAFQISKLIDVTRLAVAA